MTRTVRSPKSDNTDYALGSFKVTSTTLGLDANGRPKFLQPGESYTATASFDLPESMSGDYRVIVKADTSIVLNA